LTEKKITNIFGDDGFRCRYGEKYLTRKFLTVFSSSLANHYKKKYNKPKCVIGIDTRASGNKIYKIIASELINLNINVNFCGVLPSPGISYILKKFNFHFGIMITASHNHFEDNGIKLFNSNGFKLDSFDEKKIEISIKKNLKKFKIFKTKRKNDIPIPFENTIFKEKYIEFLKQNLNQLNLKKKIIIDCSNGASSFLMNRLFKKNKNIMIINDKPSGKNINLNCGSLHAKKLQRILKKKNYDFGLALDGDSDRCVFVDRKKGQIDSEKILFLLLKSIDKKNLNKIICSSEIVNKALEFNLAKIKYSLFQTKVGDRNVINSSRKLKSIIGFEPSGHFYFPNLNNSMDGNLTIILILNYLERNLNNFKKILKLKSYKRIIKNIRISEINIPFKTIKNKLTHIRLLKHEKLLIRQSIWDPIYRIYYDYNNNNRFKKINKILLSK
jgi:phosphoglucosamine mutase